MRTLYSSIDSIRAITLANEYDIRFPEKIAEKKKRNLKRNIWNRDLLQDFSSFDTIRRCVLYCLSEYQADNEKDATALKIYLDLLKIPYEKKFYHEIINDIRETLKAWNMDTRGSSLSELNTIETSVNAMRSELDARSKFTLTDSSVTKTK